ncbi:MAG: efflux RND transporter periplasmic adaptor subunit [Balneola sp.]
MINKKSTITITTLITLSAAIYGVITFNSDQGTEFQVQTVTASLGNVVSTVTATGTLEPTTQVDVGTQVSGEVEKIYVDFNSEVKAGQLIAELDKTNLKAAVSQAKASYQNAENEVNYREGIYNRKKALFDKNLITEEEFELAQYNYKSAVFSLSQRQSDLEEAETNLGYADIFSPINGVILSREVDEGQTVAASVTTPTLFVIAKDLKEMQVEADVDEADIGQVSEGQRVSFTVDAYQGESFDGLVTQVRLNPTTSSNVVTYTVVVNASNEDQKLKPGMTATIEIFTKELTDVLTIQAKALNFTPDETVLAAYYAQEGIEAPEMPGSREPGEDGEMAQRPPRGSGERPEGGRPPMNEDGTEMQRGFSPPEGASQSERGMRGTRGENQNEEVSIVFVKTNEGLIVPRPVELGDNDGINVEVLNGLSEGDEIVYRIVESQIETVTANETEENTRSPFISTPRGR